jgi:predicted DNA-binding protein|tara:strand:+ start:276 stop:563 length:288 start_codon:yes stop_codon:yes gene_type:complete
MNMKDFAVPGITVVFAAGISFASFESAAQDVEEIDQRVEVLESKSGKQEIIDIKIEGVEKRLDKMEDLMAKMLEVQQQQAINQAKICSATNADCD